MLKEKNELIDSKCFASLILDYDIPASPFCDRYVSCRVLIDGCYDGYIITNSVEKAIEIFRSGKRERK